MSISEDQRRALHDIVARIEEGGVAPRRVPGEVGRFLRDLASYRARLNTVLPEGETYVRGRAIGPVDLTSLVALRERTASEVIGEVASTIAVSEALAGTVNVTLWSKARSANRLLNTWLRSPDTILLAGDYRWFAPRRITPGTASVEPVEALEVPWGARCMAFAAEEFLSGPPAASYRWDDAFGPFDFRAFRVVAAHQSAEGWTVVPGADPGLAYRAQLAHVPGSDGPTGDLALALVVRTPWDGQWSIAALQPVDANRVLAHLITWADHRRELVGAPPPSAAEVSQMQHLLAELGHPTDRVEGMDRAILARRIAPDVRPFAAWARGLA